MPILKNNRHELFAGFYAKSNEAVKSYINAGFSPNGADASVSRLLKDSRIMQRIAELRTEIARQEQETAKIASEKSGIDKAWVIKELVEVVEMAKQAKPVKDAEGATIGEYQQNLSAANKALELIGKELKMFVERSEVLHGSILDSLEHNELKELESQLRAAIAFNNTRPEDTERVTH